MKPIRLSYFSLFVLLPLLNYGQQLEDNSKRQLQIEFCDQVLNGNTLPALSKFQSLILTYNSNISEYILARGINLYDSVNTDFSAKPEFISALENLRSESNYLTRLNLADCPPFSIADINAEYKGGMSELFKIIGNNLSLNEVDSTDLISFKSFIQLTVQINGSVSDVKIIKGEVLIEKQITEILINTSGQWSPGRCNCQSVPTKVIIPVNINLK